jgi:hypothetical protein
MTSKLDLVWEAPPNPGFRAYDPRLEGLPGILRSRRGEWARIAELESRKAALSLIRLLRESRYAVLPKGEFELCYRTIDESQRTRVYARCLHAPAD